MNRLLDSKYLLLALLAGLIVLRSDAPYFLAWWLCLLVLGLAFLPLADCAFGRFGSKGYVFAKTLGLAIAGYAQWLLSSARILPFRAWSVYLVVVVCAAVNIVIDRHTKTFRSYLKDRALFRSSVNKEALFAGLLILWAFMRGLKPEIIGLEKFMDFGFLNTILRSDYFPPADMWFANNGINYYYLGHYFCAFLTMMSAVDSKITYNLLMATLFALSFMLAYSIAEILIEIYQSNAKNHPLRKSAARWAGLLAGAQVCLSGTLHTVIYGVLFTGGKRYWFPDATRYIGYNPEVPYDKTIHEFPLYSFIVSDLHAHVINMVFVLTVIGLAMSAAVSFMRAREEQDGANELSSNSFFSNRLFPNICFFLVIFLIGLFPGTNFWDYPIYVTVASTLYFYANLRVYGYTPKSLAMTAAHALVTAVPAYMVTLPFQLSFESMGTEVKIAIYHSKLYQLGVLWGYQTAFFIGLLTLTILYYRSGRRTEGKTNPGAAHESKMFGLHIPALHIPARADAEWPVVFKFIERLNPADAFALVLYVCAIGLVIIPELVYIKDIYPMHPRSNTMFKLTYQAFIMFGIAVGYTYIRVVTQRDMKFKRFTVGMSAAGAVLLACAFIYPFFAIPGWHGPLMSGRYAGLDGTKYMLFHAEKLPVDGEDENYMMLIDEDYGVVEYIRKNISGQPVIVEAAGDSYTSYGRISVNTGLPTVINWYMHQYLWRNSDSLILDPRVSDVYALYTAESREEAEAVLRKYNIEYIVLGKLERNMYKARLNEGLLTNLGETVFETGETKLIRVEKNR